MTTILLSPREAARETARHIAHRLEHDPDFRLLVERDPLTTLTEAGLPAEGVRDILREADIEPEVTGYLRCSDTCWFWTCWSTCNVTN
jgi:hypothetical protein